MSSLFGDSMSGRPPPDVAVPTLAESLASLDELEVMALLVDVLGRFDGPTQSRLVTWLWGRYGGA